MEVAARVSEPVRAAVTVRPRGVDNALRQDAALPPRAHAGHRLRELRMPAVAVAEGDEVLPAGVHPRRDHGHFVGLRAAVREITFLQLPRSNLGHLFRQGDNGLSREERRSVLHAVDLRLDFLGNLGVRVPHADRDDPAQEVEVLPALDVANVLALGVVNHQRVFIVRGDAVEDVFLMLADDFVFGH